MSAFSIGPTGRSRGAAGERNRAGGRRMAGRRKSAATSSAPTVRCYTRALKNARHLEEVAPAVFAQDPDAEGFGTGVPLEILRGLHRIPHHSPVLNRHKAVAEAIRTSRPPVPGRDARDALFSGTVHFAQVTFHTPGGDRVTATSEMNQIVQYATRAAVSISEYAAQYGQNTLSVSTSLLTKTVNLSGTSFTDSNLQGWVNALATSNSFGSDHCIFVVVPQGISAANVGGNAGYHGKANIPYIVAGVFATGLTLADNPDVYAMVVSHEIAEMVVDPNVDGNNPEVCDACDINCSNLTRCYFDATDNFLGTNQNTPPSGFSFIYYTCAVVKPAGAADCPASAANCQYAPILQDCQLIVDKSTFGEDEVSVQSTYAPAYWVAVDGFTANELGFHSPSDLNSATPSPAPNVSVSIDAALNPSLTAAQISTIAAHLPTVSQLGPLPVVATDPTLAPLTQRFLYPYTISFGSNAAFGALQLDQAAVLTLTATFTVGSTTRTDSAALELVKGENPFYTDVDPTTPSRPVWLSFDLRFFKVVVPAGGTASRFGATMTNNPSDAPAFIAAAIHNLTTGSGSANGDSFAALPQDEGTSALEFLRQDAGRNFVITSAAARAPPAATTPRGAAVRQLRLSLDGDHPRLAQSGDHARTAPVRDRRDPLRRHADSDRRQSRELGQARSAQHRLDRRPQPRRARVAEDAAPVRDRAARGPAAGPRRADGALGEHAFRKLGVVLSPLAERQRDRGARRRAVRPAPLARGGRAHRRVPGRGCDVPTAPASDGAHRRAADGRSSRGRQGGRALHDRRAAGLARKRHAATAAAGHHPGRASAWEEEESSDRLGVAARDGRLPGRHRHQHTGEAARARRASAGVASLAHPVAAAHQSLVRGMGAIRGADRRTGARLRRRPRQDLALADRDGSAPPSSRRDAGEARARDHRQGRRARVRPVRRLRGVPSVDRARPRGIVPSPRACPGAPRDLRLGRATGHHCLHGAEPPPRARDDRGAARAGAIPALAARCASSGGRSGSRLSTIARRWPSTKHSPSGFASSAP